MEDWSWEFFGNFQFSTYQNCSNPRNQDRSHPHLYHPHNP